MKWKSNNKSEVQICVSFGERLKKLFAAEDLITKNKYKMKIYETKEMPTDIVTDIICDCCGESCKKMLSEALIEFNPDYKGDKYTFEYMELKATWGYFSNKDMEQWTAHLCEKCVDEKLPFIKFEKKNYF